MRCYFHLLDESFRSITNSHNLPDSPSLNSSGLTLLHPTSINGCKGCFDAASEPRPVPAQTSDCLHATLQIIQKGSVTRPIIMARRITKGFFQLPQVFRYGTCVVSVDVAHDEDEDRFPLLTIHKAALDLSMECVGGSTQLVERPLLGQRSWRMY